jgi:hypothetical protein
MTINNSVVDRVDNAIYGFAGPLHDASGIGLDASGNIYVANMSGGSRYSGTIVVFHVSSARRPRAIATIDGKDTGIDTIRGLAVDAKGNIFTASQHGVEVFSAGSNGNARPRTTLGGQSVGVALDSKGNAFVANLGIAGDKSILEFSPDNTEHTKPVAVIEGRKTGLTELTAIALDKTGDIYVANYDKGPCRVTAYGPGSNGDIAPFATVGGPHTGLFPFAIIGQAAKRPFNPNPDCHVDGVAVDAAGDLYVARGDTNQILVFAPGSNGDVAPRRIIEGSRTKLNWPYGLTLGHLP